MDCPKHGYTFARCSICVDKRITELEAENRRLRGQITLMESKAQVSFNCFWNGGWYSIVNEADT